MVGVFGSVAALQVAAQTGDGVSQAVESYRRKTFFLFKVVIVEHAELLLTAGIEIFSLVQRGLYPIFIRHSD